MQEVMCYRQSCVLMKWWLSTKWLTYNNTTPQPRPEGPYALSQTKESCASDIVIHSRLNLLGSRNGLEKEHVRKCGLQLPCTPWCHRTQHLSLCELLDSHTCHCCLWLHIHQKNGVHLCLSRMKGHRLWMQYFMVTAMRWWSFYVTQEQTCSCQMLWVCI